MSGKVGTTGGDPRRVAGAAQTARPRWTAVEATAPIPSPRTAAVDTLASTAPPPTDLRTPACPFGGPSDSSPNHATRGSSTAVATRLAAAATEHLDAPVSPGAPDAEAAVASYVQRKLLAYVNRSRLWHVLHPDARRHLLRKSEALARKVAANPADVRRWIAGELARVEQGYDALVERAARPEPDPKAKAGQPWRLLGETAEWKAKQRARACDLLGPESEGLPDAALDARLKAHVYATLDPRRSAPSEAPPVDLDQAYAQEMVRVKRAWDGFQAFRASRPRPDAAAIRRMISPGFTGPADGRAALIGAPGSPGLLERARRLGELRGHAEAEVARHTDDFAFLRFSEIPGAPEGAARLARFRDRVLTLGAGFKVAFDGLDAGMPVLETRRGPLPAILDPARSVERHTWIQEKLKDVLRTMPLALTVDSGFSSVVRSMVGITVARLHSLPEADAETLDRELFRAMQIGLYFGVAYGWVDTLQDNPGAVPGASAAKLDQLFDQVERGLCGHPIELGEAEKLEGVRLLRESFEALRTLCGGDPRPLFRDLALLMRAQGADVKAPDRIYRTDEIYLPLMMKTERTYAAVMRLSDHDPDAVAERLPLIGLIGQLTDDLHDFFEDREHGNITPYVHYAAHKDEDPTIENPLRLYIDLCDYLRTKDGTSERLDGVIARRLARGVVSVEKRFGREKLEEYVATFAGEDPELARYLLEVGGRGAEVPDPNDNFRAVRERSVAWARRNRALKTFMADHLPEIQQAIPVAPEADPEAALLVGGMNYSLLGGGKRVRPLLAGLAAEMYGIPVAQVTAVGRAIEHLHTSSLIKDDLPAQDDSELRRGRPTLHRHTDDLPGALADMAEARAQLASDALISTALEAVCELRSQGFDPGRVLDVVAAYAASTFRLCLGQLKDIRAARAGLPEKPGDTPEVRALAALEEISWLKTGQALEMAFLPAALLAGAPAEDVRNIKEFSRLLGVLYQVKDDILDAEGDPEALGKPVGVDAKNNTQTFVSVLGLAGAKAHLAALHRQTLDALERLPSPPPALREFVDALVTRDR